MADTDISKKAYEAIEVATKTGKIKKGTNEATKVIERGAAKLVLVAGDVDPPEVTMHISPLCQEKSVPYVQVGSKEELGAAAGLNVPTVCVAIVEEGDAKDVIADITKSQKKEAPKAEEKKEAAPEVKEEKKETPKAEEKKEE